MIDTTKPRAATGSASAFVVPSEVRGCRSDAWSEMGRAIELVYRRPAPMGQAVRIGVAVTLVVVAKLCLGGVL